MGSPFASLSATRGLSVNVEPSLRVAVYGRPWAAGDPPEADSTGAAVAAVLGAVVAGALPPHAATSSEAAETIVTAPREPIRMIAPPHRPGARGMPGGVSIVSSSSRCQRYWK